MSKRILSFFNTYTFGRVAYKTDSAAVSQSDKYGEKSQNAKHTNNSFQYKYVDERATYLEMACYLQSLGLFWDFNCLNCDIAAFIHQNQLFFYIVENLLQDKGTMIPVSSRAFMAMQNLTIAELSKCDEKELRPLLPCLVRMATLKQLDNTKTTIDGRTQILSLLVGIVEVNNIVSLLQIDFHELETDIRKEQQLR